MDDLSKFTGAVMILWVGAMTVGLLIALMPVIVAVFGFVLMVAVVGFVARLVASWFGY
jgi:hypothetical protein